MHDALELLSGLSDADISWILDSGQEQQVMANTVIIEEGSHSESIYFVLSGLVGVHVSPLRASSIANLGPGELLGEISFLEGSPASATVTALENSLLLALSRKILHARMQEDQGFASRLYRSFALVSSRRLRERVGTLGRLLRGKTADATEVGDCWQRIADRITEFKSIMQKADQEALKNDNVVPDGTANEVRASLMDLVLLLNDEIGDSSSESLLVRDEIGARVQREFLPYLLLTRVGERMYSKPRGYAGDYMTIEWMYRNEPDGAGRLGPLLDSAILDAPAICAVRNRIGLMAEEVLSFISANEIQRTRVTSLACGPARELFAVLEQLDDASRLEATLIDIDLESLAYVSNQLEKRKLRRHFGLVHGNLVYLATGKQSLDLSDQDLVYSIGLIDYFSDKFVIQLLNYIHDLLRPGGKVILGNFHVNDPCKAFGDYVLDWRFTRRTEEDMNRLYAASRFGQPCSRIRFEESGINMFAECYKK